MSFISVMALFLVASLQCFIYQDIYLSEMSYYYHLSVLKTVVLFFYIFLETMILLEYLMNTKFKRTAFI